MSSVINALSHAKPARVPKAAKLCPLDRVFTLHRGAVLHKPVIAYETWGTLSPSADNAILILGGLSSHSHVSSSTEDTTPGWWEHMVGSHKAIDTNRYYVIAINSLGGCHGSTGAASLNPDNGQTYALDFPELCIEDMAKAANQLVIQLGIAQLNTLVGASLGGMTALSYALQFPQSLKRLVVLSASCNATPFAIAIRSLQRDMIRTDPLWRNGNYDISQPPSSGMRLARKAGLISYRSPQEWLTRFGRDKIPGENDIRPFDAEFEIESYLDHNADKFARNFDPNSYLYLSRSMDWFNIEDYHADRNVDCALAQIAAEKILVIGVKSDLLFPLWQQQVIAEALLKANKEVQFCRFDSVQGHDAFLADKTQFSSTIARFLHSLH